MTRGAAGDPELHGRRRLGAELRGLRELAGLSGRELARRIELSQSQVSRIESGTSLPNLPQIRAWSTAVNAPIEAVAWLTAALEELRTEVRPWRSVLADHPNPQQDIRLLEAQSRVIRCFQPLMVPGLLQVAEYARQVFGMGRAVPFGPEDTAAAVAGRMDRQLALYAPTRRFEFVLGEGALRWRPGSVATQLAQLDRIGALSTLDNVSIGVIPFAIRARTLLSHGFVIYTGDEDSVDESIVAIELFHAGVTTKTSDDVQVYESHWADLTEMAVFDDEARAFLTTIASETRRSAE